MCGKLWHMQCKGNKGNCTGEVWCGVSTICVGVEENGRGRGCEEALLNNVIQCLRIMSDRLDNGCRLRVMGNLKMDGLETRWRRI